MNSICTDWVFQVAEEDPEVRAAIDNLVIDEHLRQARLLNSEGVPQQLDFLTASMTEAELVKALGMAPQP
jgi:hypothetical protein